MDSRIIKILTIAIMDKKIAILFMSYHMNPCTVQQQQPNSSELWTSWEHGRNRTFLKILLRKPSAKFQNFDIKESRNRSMFRSEKDPDHPRTQEFEGCFRPWLDVRRGETSSVKKSFDFFIGYPWFASVLFRENVITKCDHLSWSRNKVCFLFEKLQSRRSQRRRTAQLDFKWDRPIRTELQSVNGASSESMLYKWKLL